MTLDHQLEIAKMLEAAAEIMRSDRDPMIKIQTLTRIGDTTTFLGRKWGDETFNRFIDNMNLEQTNA